MLTPDKQNQNALERNIDDVKHRVGYTIFASQDPILFWCYCMKYLVYCLNLMAWHHSNSRISTLALTGLIPDISHLKFNFCKKARYYEYNGNFPLSPWKFCRVSMFAYHQGDKITYKIWTVDKNDNLEDGWELTYDIVIPRVSNHETPATSLLTLQDYKQLQFKTLSTHLKQKTAKMTGKRNRKWAADKASRPGPTQCKQRKAAPWIDKFNDELTLFTDDLTDNEEDYENFLDPVSHQICQPPFSDHNPDNVPVSIVTGGEEEDADYIFNNYDPLS